MRKQCNSIPQNYFPSSSLQIHPLTKHGKQSSPNSTNSALCSAPAVSGHYLLIELSHPFKCLPNMFRNKNHKVLVKNTNSWAPSPLSCIRISPGRAWKRAVKHSHRQVHTPSTAQESLVTQRIWEILHSPTQVDVNSTPLLLTKPKGGHNFCLNNSQHLLNS